MDAAAKVAAVSSGVLARQTRQHEHNGVLVGEPVAEAAQRVAVELLFRIRARAPRLRARRQARELTRSMLLDIRRRRAARALSLIHI